MTRFGWGFLALVLLAFAAFVAMTRFGGDSSSNVVSVPPSQSGAPGPSLIVPVQGVARSAVADSWGDVRGGRRAHHGTDIPAAAGTPVLAAADGTVEKLFASARGGITLYERSHDRRWIFYYAHLAGYAPGVAEGRTVRTGQSIGYVGDTGDAGTGNFHLHFGLTRTTPDQRWYEGEDVNAYPLLAAPPPAR